jgi:hypothetical protein
MIALTGDFYVFASRVTTRFSTVFFSISHIAKTWYVRALFCLLIRHKKSSFRVPPAFHDHCSAATLDVPKFLHRPECI